MSKWIPANDFEKEERLWNMALFFVAVSLVCCALSVALHMWIQVGLGGDVHVPPVCETKEADQ